MPKITKRFVDTLKPTPETKGDVFAWDDDLKGFGVRMKPSGSASYLVQYPHPAGPDPEISLRQDQHNHA